ncbi:hypothetical protein VTH06DRAFT_8239 [Thermothelomyces fergusii]
MRARRSCHICPSTHQGGGFSVTTRWRCPSDYVTSTKTPETPGNQWHTRLVKLGETSMPASHARLPMRDRTAH